MYVLDETEEKVKVKLWLKKNEEGLVRLSAKNNRGEEKVLVMFFPNGTIHFVANARMEGIATDDYGCIGKNLKDIDF